MAEGTTTYGDINQRTAAFAAADMLRHSEPWLILSKMGMTKPLPKNKAETMKFRRPIPLAAATTPVVEGVTPTAQKISYEDVSVTLKQYGRPIEITDKVTELSEDPVMDTATMLAGEQAGATIEQVLYGILRAGTNVFYANGASRSAVNTVLTLNKQRAVTRALAAQKALKITRMLKSGPEYGVSAVEAAYVAVAHTDLDSDIRNLTGFIPVAKYGSRPSSRCAISSRRTSTRSLTRAGSTATWSSRPPAPMRTCIPSCTSARMRSPRCRSRAKRLSFRWSSTPARRRRATRWASAAMSRGRRGTRRSSSTTCGWLASKSRFPSSNHLGAARREPPQQE
jgi:hypothetical protein